MGEGSRRKLERLLERKRRAEELPTGDKIKWKKQIDKLDMEINEIKMELGMIEWEEYEAVNILREANLYLSSTLSWIGHGEGFNEFLKDNPDLLKVVKEVDRAVDEAFYKKDLEEVREVVESYKEIYARVNKVWRDSERLGGFREVLDCEEGYLLNPWR